MPQPVTNKGFGINADISQQTDPLHNASRVSLRPNDPGALGNYQIGLYSGVVAAGMTGPLAIWEMRWPVSGYNALVRRLRFWAMMDGTAFAQGSVIFSLFRATKFTVLDATGAQTAPVILGKDQGLSQRYAPSQLQSTGPAGASPAFAILSTANTGLTAGTKTLDANPIAVLGGSVGASPLARITEGYFIDPTEAGGEPIELMQNEGLVIRAELVAATGTWKFGVEVGWREIDPARYFKV